MTAMFMHSGWLHIIGNMIYLWAFAPEIEDAMGRFRFLIFYLLEWAGSGGDAGAGGGSHADVVGARRPGRERCDCGGDGRAFIVTYPKGDQIKDRRCRGSCCLCGLRLYRPQC